jgi:hypothetical protein
MQNRGQLALNVRRFHGSFFTMARLHARELGRCLLHTFNTHASDTDELRHSEPAATPYHPSK